jgi:hypothetical protein
MARAVRIHDRDAVAPGSDGDAIGPWGGAPCLIVDEDLTARASADDADAREGDALPESREPRVRFTIERIVGGRVAQVGVQRRHGLLETTETLEGLREVVLDARPRIHGVGALPQLDGFVVVPHAIGLLALREQPARVRLSVPVLRPCTTLAVASTIDAMHAAHASWWPTVFAMIHPDHPRATHTLLNLMEIEGGLVAWQTQ